MKKLRYYYYISKAKLDMLEPQVTGKTRLAEITPRVELSSPAGGSVGLEVQFAREVEAQTLPGRLELVLEGMRRKRLLAELEQEKALENGAVFHDTAPWYHGLFSFGGEVSLDKRARVISYLAWRPWKDSIILLAGSPANILGEKFSQDGVEVKGTLGTWSLVTDFASQAFRSEEEDGYLEVSGLEPPSQSAPAWLVNGAQAKALGGASLPMEFITGPNGFSLSLLCVRFLAKLPLQRLDTAFRISQSLSLSRKDILPRWANALLDDPQLNSSARDLLWRCKRIHLGSPIYTSEAG